MAEILDIAGKPLRPRRRMKQQLKKQDLHDLGKIATVLAVVAIGYAQFVPDTPEERTQSMALTRD